MAQLGFLDLCALARSSASKGDYKTAQTSFDQALQIKPDSIEALSGLATVYYLARDYDTAIEKFKGVLKLDPLNAGAAINLGAIFNIKGNYDEAVKFLLQGIKHDRTRSEGYYNLGIAYRKLGKTDLAVQAYREAHHLNHKMVEAVYNLANLYFEQERFDQALASYKKALEIRPDFARARNGLAKTEQKMQELAKVKVKDAFSHLDDDVVSDIDQVPEEILDRLMNPDQDQDVLKRFHYDTEEAKKAVQIWSQCATDACETVRELTLCLTDKKHRGNLQDAVRKFRLNVNQLRQAAGAYQKVFDHTLSLRDKLLEKT